MSASQPGRIRELWYRWKSLKLPWRKRWLVGRDLTGTTFWELHSPLTPTRPRRIARYPSTTHYADVSHSPAWMQWLRYTRPSPPSITEQQNEMTRQRNLQQLAAAADQRWAEKPSLLDKPEDTGQLGAQMLPRDTAADQPQHEDVSKQGVRNAVKTGEELEGLARGEDVDKGRFKGETREKPRTSPRQASTTEQAQAQQEDPWRKHQQTEGWQPKTWQPGSVPGKRGE